MVVALQGWQVELEPSLQMWEVQLHGDSLCVLALSEYVLLDRALEHRRQHIKAALVLRYFSVGFDLEELSNGCLLLGFRLNFLSLWRSEEVCDGELFRAPCRTWLGYWVTWMLWSLNGSDIVWRHCANCLSGTQ